MSKICNKVCYTYLLDETSIENIVIFDFFFFDFFRVPKDKTSKMLDGTVWYVKRCAFKRRFQKYVTLFNRFNRSRVMAETPKLYSFIPLLYMSYNSLAQKVLPNHNSVRFCFFAQKGVFNFQNSKKNGWPDKFYCLRIPDR